MEINKIAKYMSSNPSITASVCGIGSDEYIAIEYTFCNYGEDITFLYEVTFTQDSWSMYVEGEFTPIFEGEFTPIFEGERDVAADLNDNAICYTFNRY